MLLLSLLGSRNAVARLNSRTYEWATPPRPYRRVWQPVLTGFADHHSREPTVRSPLLAIRYRKDGYSSYPLGSQSCLFAAQKPAQFLGHILNRRCCCRPGRANQCYYPVE
jgi:hypothetical protein